jgi:hypothetical protein
MREQSPRDARWLAAASVVVCLIAARVVWLAWSYYFRSSPRYQLESGAIALVTIGSMVLLLRPGDELAASTGPERMPLMWLPISVVAALWIYGPAFRLGLLSDDYVLRALAQSGAFGVGSTWFFRPLPLVLWRLVLAVSRSAVPLHALNVLLHGVNAFLVAMLGSRLGMRREAALGAAALFLTFPAAPEAVAWASGLQDVLMTTLALGAVIAASNEHRVGWRMAGVMGMLALGLASKETAICIPALIAICWAEPLRMRHLRDWRLYAGLVAVVVGYSLIRISLGIREGYLVTPSRYFLKQLITNAFGTLATPWRAPTSPPARWLAFVAVVAVALLLTHALLTWQRRDPAFHRAARFALWVLAAVAPVFSYFYVSPLLEGSRYVYLAECGWALLITDLICTLTDRLSQRSLVFVCAVGILVVVSTITLEQELGVWRRAADLRDRVLTEAHLSIARGRCGAVRFADVPDSLDGAYVFRNGFQEALGSSTGSATRGKAECFFKWSGESFVPSAERKSE